MTYRDYNFKKLRDLQVSLTKSTERHQFFFGTNSDSNHQMNHLDQSHRNRIIITHQQNHPFNTMKKLKQITSTESKNKLSKNTYTNRY